MIIYVNSHQCRHVLLSTAGEGNVFTDVCHSVQWGAGCTWYQFLSGGRVSLVTGSLKGVGYPEGRVFGVRLSRG